MLLKIWIVVNDFLLRDWIATRDTVLIFTRLLRRTGLSSLYSLLLWRFTFASRLAAAFKRRLRPPTFPDPGTPTIPFLFLMQLLCSSPTMQHLLTQLPHHSKEKKEKKYKKEKKRKEFWQSRPVLRKSKATQEFGPSSLHSLHFKISSNGKCLESHLLQMTIVTISNVTMTVLHWQSFRMQVLQEQTVPVTTDVLINMVVRVILKSPYNCHSYMNYVPLE